VHARFLLGPAGSGKTFRCLAEIREELARATEGPDLILLAPKQATFQLERQLLADERVRGYTRLQILSFERLAAYVLEQLGKPLPELLSEEGRVMVMRAILEQEHSNLRVFRASARLSGFSRQLSSLLQELQRRRLGPDAIVNLAAKENLPPHLANKLSDIALILRAYFEWVDSSDHGRFEDAPRLLDVAVEALGNYGSRLQLGGLWLDGFAEMTPQEQELLAALLPHCERATLAFCLPWEPRVEESWLSPWSVVAGTVQECHLRLRDLADVELEFEVLNRDVARGRFSERPVLAQVERAMAQRQRQKSTGDLIASGLGRGVTPSGLRDSLRLVECSDMDAEAVLAAREILQFVHRGGRFRDCAVLVRSLDGYQDALRRVLTRYDIPFFLDHREPVAHHPLAELTRFALRTAAFDWPLDEWLGALKTGLSGLSDHEVDRLENAALARGWEGATLWLRPLPANDDTSDRDRLEILRARVIKPFATLHHELRDAQWAPTGVTLAAAVRTLWLQLKIETRLEEWGRSSPAGAVHSTVWEQMNDWLDNLELAFREVALPLREWLQIIEAGLSGLTVGVIPPALDQVLVGSVDRSRNPDLRFALVLGMNESVFPAPPPGIPLLSEADVIDLETHGVRVGHGRRQFGHEYYLGYIALTRARQQLLVTWSAADVKGHPQNASRLVDELRRAFPEHEVERFDGIVQWNESCHPDELARALLDDAAPSGLESLRQLAGVRPAVERWQQVTNALHGRNLSPETAAALYGNELNLSVSALEAFASCPFKFFVSYGLRARERDEFDVDVRQTGSFQHEVLAEFHRRVKASGRRWRELAPTQAVEWVREIGEAQLVSYEHGLFLADAAREFQARALLQNLERVVTTLTLWSRQNEFEPAAVEVSFGLDENGWPGWRLDLGGGQSVQVRGRVDRLDLLPTKTGSTAVAIFDYKSNGKRFEDLKFENGLQLQMPAYLSAICENREARLSFGAPALRPAGVFYGGLRVKPGLGRSRTEAQEKGVVAALGAFQHLGRFDASLVAQFDTSGARKGEQFRFSFNKNGSLSKRGNDALPATAFAGLLADAAQQICELASRILKGETEVSPYKQGQEVACGLCAFRPVCRFDSWAEAYRPLKRRPTAVNNLEGAGAC